MGWVGIEIEIDSFMSVLQRSRVVLKAIPLFSPLHPIITELLRKSRCESKAINGKEKKEKKRGTTTVNEPEPITLQ